MNKYKAYSKAKIGRVYARVSGSAKMCLRKAAFSSGELAKARADQLQMRAYECPHCKRWHLTSKL